MSDMSMRQQDSMGRVFFASFFNHQSVQDHTRLKPDIGGGIQKKIFFFLQIENGQR
jgi:hypothetical protein